MPPSQLVHQPATSSGSICRHSGTNQHLPFFSITYRNQELASQLPLQESVAPPKGWWHEILGAGGYDENADDGGIDGVGTFRHGLCPGAGPFGFCWTF
jgi:hypothetical protein